MERELAIEVVAPLAEKEDDDDEEVDSKTAETSKKKKRRRRIPWKVCLAHILATWGDNL